MKTPHERLQAFLYILGRDHLPAGVVDEIIQKYVEEAGDHPILGHPNSLEPMASDWADRLIGKEEAEPEYRFGIFDIVTGEHRVTGESRSFIIYLTHEEARRNLPKSFARVPAAEWRIYRGRVIETTTTVANEIEWEDGPV